MFVSSSLPHRVLRHVEDGEETEEVEECVKDGGGEEAKGVLNKRFNLPKWSSSTSWWNTLIDFMGWFVEELRKWMYTM